MDVTDQILNEKRYKKQLDQLSNELLTKIAEDHVRALEMAHKGIKQEEPGKINDVEYLQAIADGMQKLARRVLEERERKS